nr:hypothetical protein CFP56_28041 [Quercus suber]
MGLVAMAKARRQSQAKGKVAPVDTLPSPWPTYLHAPKTMIAPMGKQPWQSHTTKFKAAPMGKATMAKKHCQGQGIIDRQAAKAKAALVGTLPGPRHAGLPK